MNQRNWPVRELRADELDGIYDIDVRETGDVVYYWVDGEAKPVAEHWERETRAPEHWRSILSDLMGALASGGWAYGAFDKGRMVGVAVLKRRLADDVALLAGLWVSRDWRRRGIARALVERALDRARRSGAGSVYVSAMPSESAQRFYRALGFKPTIWVHQEMFKKEPEDIHMTLAL